MDFKALTEEELNSYVENVLPEEKIHSNLKKTVVERFLKIANTIEKHTKDLKNTAHEIDDGNYNVLYSLSNISKGLQRNAERINETIRDFGICDEDESKVYKEMIAGKEVSFQRDGTTLIIDLPELLPHRPSYDTVTKQMRYYYDVSQWKSAYMQSFAKEFETGKFKIYEEKVAIIFFHHYNINKKIFPDIDNLETKHIIDIITFFLLRDDSYKYVCYFTDTIEDTKDYTEIIVCPKSQMYSYI